IGAVEVENDPPVIYRSFIAATINEGAGLTFDYAGGFDDPQGRSSVTLTASLGRVSPLYFTGAWYWLYEPTDGPSGSTDVTLTAPDEWGAAATTTFSLTVKNVPPSLTQFSVPATASEGDTVTLSAAATDPGTGDSLTYTWLIVDPIGFSNRWEGA